jgi:hypothetical protein
MTSALLVYAITLLLIVLMQVALIGTNVRSILRNIVPVGTHAGSVAIDVLLAGCRARTGLPHRGRRVRRAWTSLTHGRRSRLRRAWTGCAQPATSATAAAAAQTRSSPVDLRLRM